MKRFLVIFMVLCCIITKSFATNVSTCNADVDSNNIISHETYLLSMLEEKVSVKYEKEIENDTLNMCYYNFIKNTIPAKFVKPFYEFTNTTKNIGIEILGIADWESGWKVFEGPVNKNGSVDKGPLMLNSFNIINPEFMAAFDTLECQKYKYDEDIYYMCICINYYKSLRGELGPYTALQVYNGGYRAISKKCSSNLKKTVTLYANKVYNLINKHYDEWCYVKENDFDFYKTQIISKYARKAYYDLAKSNNIFNSNKKYSFEKYDYLSHSKGGNIDILYIREVVFDDETYNNFILGKWKDNVSYYYYIKEA